MYVFTQESFESNGRDFCVMIGDFALKTTDVCTLLGLLEGVTERIFKQEKIAVSASEVLKGGVVVFFFFLDV